MSIRMSSFKYIITNYWYSFNGNRHYFVTLGEAIFDFSQKYPEIYKSCIDPKKYINVVNREFVILKTNQTKE